MEKKLKKVQRGAAIGFVLLKILRILLIIAFVALVAGLVFLAVADWNDLPLNAVQDGKLVIDMQTLDLSQLNLDKVPSLGGLVQDGVLTLDLKDGKLAVLMLLGACVLALVAVYVLLLVAGKIFKHIKKEDTPFTAGNIRRLRLLGILILAFWACGIALTYYVSSKLVYLLALSRDNVILSPNLISVLIALIFFFLARLFSFGKAQGEALQAAAPAPAPAPVPEPMPEPVYQAPAPEPVPVVEEPAPAAEEPAPVVEEVPAEAAEAPAVPEE